MFLDVFQSICGVPPPMPDPGAGGKTERRAAAPRPPQPFGLLVIKKVAFVKRPESTEGLLGDGQQGAPEASDGQS